MVRNIYYSDFYCTKCSNKVFALPRKASKQYEPGHLKNLWCPHCQREQNCAEVRPFGQKYTLEDFKIEYEMGNFDENGKRKETYRQCIARYYKER